jgi:hypothetical protein
MNFKENAGRVSEAGGQAGERNGAGEELNLELDEALREFRLCVCAWSEAALSRPRTALAAAPRRRVWRLAAGWALSCALLAASVSGGFYGRRLQEMKRIAQARQAEQQRVAAEQRTQMKEEGLPAKVDRDSASVDSDLASVDSDLAEMDSDLAKVDSDVSRGVPSAMEPLARLMAGEVTQ